ncbi:hypothetical protein WJX73_008586 [Symbiochloris irregularis]|uniref:3'(2'),5'-bisphosphate nucleotidase n=1 Tax=Symbiochloris irregularis TaxID=706552 RepID=A0AAW1P538_9CHLO
MQVLERGKYASAMKRACEAVRLGSALCQNVQLQLKQAEAASKSDKSPVTIADYATQAVVAWSLQRGQGGGPLQMVAEEDSEDLRTEEGASMADRITELVNNAVAAVEPGSNLSRQQVLDLIDLGQHQGGPEGSFWVLDPIDGTRGFVGMRQYAVCLGLVDQGQVVLGVLGCPNLPVEPITPEQGEAGAAEHAGEPGYGCMFAAQLHEGSFVGPLQGDAPWQELQLTDHSDFSHIRFMESYEKGHSDHSFTAKLAKALGITKAPLRLDSQAKYGALARGDAAVILRFPNRNYREKIWDHCAGAVIVQEAGGIISDAAGTPLGFGRGRWLDLDKGIVTSTPKAHAALIKAIAQLVQEGHEPA